MVYSCLKQLRKSFPHIRVCVVLAYLQTEKSECDDMSDMMYPEIEGYPKLAVERRNRWLIDHAECGICYINHTWCGAYKFVRLAKQRGKHMINIGNSTIEA